jgi:hypothetical protein
MHNARLIFRGGGIKKRVKVEITHEAGKCERKGRKKKMKLRRNAYVISVLVMA